VKNFKLNFFFSNQQGKQFNQSEKISSTNKNAHHEDQVEESNHLECCKKFLKKSHHIWTHL